MRNPIAVVRRLVPVALLVLTAVNIQAQKAAGPVKIKLGTLAPKDSSFHKVLLGMGSNWQKSGASLTVYPGGAIGGEADMVRKMKIGQLDAGLLTVVGLSEISPSVEALQSMPMMFRTLEEVDYVGMKLRPRLEQDLRKAGFVVLFWADAGWVRFFSKDPLTTPEQMKKAKLFTWAGDPNALSIMRSAGFHPVPLETNDILPSLQTGLINAVPMPPYVALATQVFGPAKNMLELNWAPLVGGLVVHERAWKKLVPAQQKALAQAAANAGSQMKSENRRGSDAAVQAMVKRGLKINKVTPAVEAAWRREAEAVYPKIRGRIVPADMFDEVQRLLKEYRAGKR